MKPSGEEKNSVEKVYKGTFRVHLGTFRFTKVHLSVIVLDVTMRKLLGLLELKLSFVWGSNKYVSISLVRGNLLFS